MVAILLACLLSAPTSCASHEMPLREELPYMQMVEAQSWAVEWSRAHPGWRVKRVAVVRGRSA